MTITNYYYGCLIIITFLPLLTAQVGAGDDAAGSLLGGKKLIIGVPKKTGFTQFVDLELNSSNKNQVVKATGYSIDVFEAAIAYLKSLDYHISFEYKAFVDEHGNSAGDYNALVYQIFERKNYLFFLSMIFTDRIKPTWKSLGPHSMWGLGRESTERCLDLQKQHIRVLNLFFVVIVVITNTSYNKTTDITCISNEQYDAVVGDVAIVANRSNYVDFTLPYAPYDVKMLVKVRSDPRLNMWIFVQPFSLDLWFSIAFFSITIGGIIVFMERRVNNEDSTLENSPSRKQLSKSSILWLPVLQVVLPERESLVKNPSRFVLVMWLILVFILMQSYTACLSSILTVHQLQPQYLGEYDVIDDGNIIVGYHRDSFIRGLLVDQLNISRSRVKNYIDINEYKEALDKGSKKDGVDGIFDQVSHVKVFLRKYGSNYAMLETRHRTDGFAFAFPQGSNLTSYFSRAILNVSESKEMDNIKEKYFGSCRDNYEGQGLLNSSLPDNASSRLTTYSFAGLFMLSGILSLFALIVSESHIWRKPAMLARTYSRQFLIRCSFTRTFPLEEGSTTRRNVDEEGFTTREHNQNIGLQDGANNHGEISKASLSCVVTDETLPV